MSDLIRREDAIDIVKMHHFYALNADERAQAILDIPSADRPQEWIPCSERLPANDDWVIASILDEVGDTPYRYSDFGWYFERAKCWIIDSEQRTDVVAWMPLPKPWKGADDE